MRTIVLAAMEPLDFLQALRGHPGFADGGLVCQSRKKGK